MSWRDILVLLIGFLAFTAIGLLAAWCYAHGILSNGLILALLFGGITLALVLLITGATQPPPTTLYKHAGGYVLIRHDH